MGEGLPYNTWRVDHRNSWVKSKPHNTLLRKKIVDYFNSNFYITTSGNFRTQTLIDAILEIGPDRILFTGDYPFEGIEEATLWFDNTSISERDRVKIGKTNSNNLFKLNL